MNPSLLARVRIDARAVPRVEALAEGLGCASRGLGRGVTPTKSSNLAVRVPVAWPRHSPVSVKVSLPRNSGRETFVRQGFLTNTGSASGGCFEPAGFGDPAGRVVDRADEPVVNGLV